MYKIDWTKYINSGRLRKSSKEEQRLAHPDENIDKRSPFESDFGRVVFSSAARRMHDKTQVFPLNIDDNIHTRLTHSIEVMNIGYSIGASITRNKDFREAYNDTADDLAWQICAILKTACFIHDIGNPPFGHFGEDAIKTYFDRTFSSYKIESNNLILGNGLTVKNVSNSFLASYLQFVATEEKYDFTQFDGNAEGFRIVTKLQYLDDLYGLNLTYSTLAAYLKYPNTGTKVKNENKKDYHISQSKHGVFYTEREYLREIASNCTLQVNDTLYKRHPLSYLVEAADSICYLTMDIEDSVGKGWNSLESMRKDFSNNNTIKRILSEIRTMNDAQQNVPLKKQLVDFRVKLIDYFVNLTVNNFIKNLEKIDNGEYNNELIKDDDNKVAEDLGNFCHDKIFIKKDIVKLELAGDSIIKGLLDHYMYLLLHPEKDYLNRARTTIPAAIINTIMREYNKKLYTTDDFEKFKLSDLPLEYRFRIIRDHIALMTDKFAMNLNSELNGQRI